MLPECTAIIERPGSGVGLKKNCYPVRRPAKLKLAAAIPPITILDISDRAGSEITLGGVAGPGGGYELAVTSQTFGPRARYFPQEIAI